MAAELLSPLLQSGLHTLGTESWLMQVQSVEDQRSVCESSHAMGSLQQQPISSNRDFPFDGAQPLCQGLCWHGQGPQLMLSLHEPFPDAWRPLLGIQPLVNSVSSCHMDAKQLSDLPRKL